MQIEQAWDAMEAGDLARARAALTELARGGEIIAMINLAHIQLYQGDLEGAQRAADAAAQAGGSQELTVLLAQLAGERGQRDVACEQLRRFLQQQPNQPLAMAVLGEQRLRMGYWDEGAQLLIGAFKHDMRRAAMLHFTKVAQDLTRAVAASKIRPEEALKLLNRIDYSVPSNNPQDAAVFAAIRRALNGATAFARPEAIPALRGRSAGAAAQRSAPQPMPASHASQPQQQRVASVPQPQRQQQPSQRVSLGGAPVGALATPQPEAQHHMRAQLPLVDQRPMMTNISDNKSGRESLQLIMEERRLNAALLESIEVTEPTTWPSEREVMLDNIVLPQSPSVDMRAGLLNQNFTVAQGSIFSQIYMKRCLEAMLESLPTSIAGTLAVHPDEVVQLQLNVMDGFLEQMTPVLTDELDEQDGGEPKLIALGTFLGDALVNALNASWSYHRDPSKSRIRIGKQELNPFELAAQWLASKDPDDVPIQRFLSQARAARPEELFIPVVYEYIDMTRGLVGPALVARVAELWSFYRFALASVPAHEVQQETELVMEDEELVIFHISERFCPKMPAAWRQRGRTQKGGYLLAHLRRTGEFVFLASRSGLCQALERRFGAMTQGNVQEVMKLLRDYHAPAHTLVLSAQDGPRLGAPTAPQPALRQHGEVAQLVYAEVLDQRVTMWALTYDPAQPLTWSIGQLR